MRDFPVFYVIYTCIGRVYSLTVILSIVLLKKKAEDDDSATSKLDVSTFRAHDTTLAFCA